MERDAARAHAFRPAASGSHWRALITRVFQTNPPQRKRFKQGFFTDGRIVTWEYPRVSPDGDQMELVEIMEIDKGLIQRHRVYWAGTRSAFSSTNEQAGSFCLPPKYSACAMHHCQNVLAAGGACALDPRGDADKIAFEAARMKAAAAGREP